MMKTYLCFLLFLTTGVLQDPALCALPTINRGPYLSMVTQNSVVVSWATSSQAFSAVEFGTTSAYGSIILDSAEVAHHSLTVAGLSPATEYHYRVLSGSDTSSDYVFRTASPFGQSFVFVAYGDSRTDHAAHVSVLSQIVPFRPAFVLHSGDLVTSSTTSEWDAYFNDICRTTSVGATSPTYVAMGNHDNGTLYYDNLYLPHNNPDSTEAYYSYDYGNTHVICLNTEISFAMGSPQYAWLLEDLASPEASAATFRIACWHKPPYSSGNHGSDLAVRNTLCPVLEAHHVDIVFTGHDHMYERTIPINGTTYVVTGGGGAPLYDFVSTNSWTAYREKAHHFCLVEVDSVSLRMYMIRSDGAVRDSLVITRSPTGLEEEGNLMPSHPRLYDNHPNPFNPSTMIEYRTTSTQEVTLKVYDVLGREVTTLVDEVKEPGRYAVTWNASAAASGVYYYRLRSGDFVQTKKMILMK